MAGRSVNVELKVKAQDEASKALDTVAKSLKDLGSAGTALQGGTGGVGKFVEDLGKNLGSLDALFKKLDSSLASTSKSYDLQTGRLSALNGSITERKRRIEELTATEARYQQQLSKTFVGPREQGVTRGALSGVSRDLTRQTTGLQADTAKIDALIGKIADAREATQAIRGVQGQVATAIQQTNAEYLKQIDVLNRLTAAEKQAGAAAEQAAANRRVGATVNRVTGVDRAPVDNAGLRAQRETDLAKTFAPVFAAEDVAATREAAAAFDVAEKQAKEAASALAQMQQYARDVAEALDPAAKATRLLAAEQERLDAAVSGGFLSKGQADAQIGRFKAQLDGSALAAEKTSREFDSLSTYVQELRREFDRAGYAERFLETETKKLNSAVKAGILDQREYAKALEAVKRKAEQLGEQSNPQILGLNPYQTQNLLFQFNDIATQLASGTSLTQTLSQQGGQILQLFPKVGNSIVGAFTAGRGAVLGFIAVALAPLVIGLKEAFDQAERFRQFEGIIAAVATESSSSVEAINAAAKAIDRYGLSAEESIAITKRLLREGFDATQIREFATTAKDMADVLGLDVNQALTLLTDAYTGNFEALTRLMDESGAFTPAQREVIANMYAQGDATKAVDQAFAILSKSMNEGATKARGPWSEAFRNLGNAWDDLAQQLGNTWWAKAALDGVNSLADALDWLTGRSKAARDAEAERMGIYANGQGGYNTANDPLYTNAVKGGPDDPALRKTDREDSVGTAEQQNNAAKLTTEAQRQAILSREIKSQADINAKLAVIRAQAEEAIGNSVVKAERDRIVGLRVDEKRIEYAKTLEAYTKRQAQEEARLAKERNTGLYQAMELLRKSEGRGGKSVAKPYWDVNAWRAGFGSDTFTNADGTVGRFGNNPNVRPNTSVTPAMAERDLERRAAELIDVIKKRIGAERFGDFSAKQQGAIVSLYYNYGKNADRIKKDLEPILQAGTNEQIAAMVRSFANDAPRRANGKAVNYDRRMAEADILAQPNDSVAESAQEFVDKSIEKQTEFNRDLEEEIAKRERSVEAQRELVGLQGEALLNAQKEQAVQEAIAAARAKLRDTLNDPTANLTADQEAGIRNSVEGGFDLQRNTVVQTDLQTKVNELLALRDSIQAQIQSELERGNTGTAKNLEAQLGDINGRLRTSAQELLDYQIANAEALGLSAEAIDTLKLKQDALNESTRQWVSILGIGGEQIANTFTNLAVNALDQFAQAVANGENVFKSMWTAFRQFAADFLLQIAKMIQQQLIFNLISGLLKAVGGAAGGAANAAGAATNSLGGGFSNFNLSSLQFHKGGLVGGGGGEFRSVSPAMFANANRYHSGGIAGLKPGEVPSILMRGEEVLTRDDPRHMLNSGGGGGGNVKIVNTFDAEDFFSKGANTKAGEKAIMNLVRSNPRAFKQAMGGA